jgi:hypothetical protein
MSAFERLLDECTEAPTLTTPYAHVNSGMGTFTPAELRTMHTLSDSEKTLLLPRCCTALAQLKWTASVSRRTRTISKALAGKIDGGYAPLFMEVGDDDFPILITSDCAEGDDPKMKGFPLAHNAQERFTFQYRPHFQGYEQNAGDTFLWRAGPSCFCFKADNLVDQIVAKLGVFAPYAGAQMIKCVGPMKELFSRLKMLFQDENDSPIKLQNCAINLFEPMVTNAPTSEYKYRGVHAHYFALLVLGGTVTLRIVGYPPEEVPEGKVIVWPARFFFTVLPGAYYVTWAF